MKFSLPILLSLLFMFCGITQTQSQQRTLHGTLEDPEGYPLIGATVQIKGTENGTITDMDGKYRVKCQVGDTLVVRYIGYTNQHMAVTWNLFKNKKVKFGQSITIIKDHAYKKSILPYVQKNNSIPSFKGNTTLKIDRKSSRHLYNIQNVKVANGAITLSSKEHKLFFDLNFLQDQSFLFIPKNRIPQTQTTYAQGRSLNGVLQFQNAMDRETLSFGPKMSTIGLTNQENTIYKSGIKFSNGLQLKTKYQDHLINIFLGRTQFDDPFRIQKSNSKEINVLHVYKNFSSNFSYRNNTDGLSIINGNPQKVLMHHLLTPAHYDNEEAFTNDQNYNGNQFSNPLQILNQDQNEIIEHQYSGGIKWKQNFYHLQLESNLSFNSQNSKLLYQRKHSNTISDAIQYQKQISTKSWNWNSKFSSILRGGIKLESNLGLSHTLLDFSLTNSEDVFQTDLNRKIANKKLALNWNKSFDWNNPTFELKLSNGVHASTLHGLEWLQPKIFTSVNLISQRNYKLPFQKLFLHTSFSSYIKELDLYYNNNSHNSLLHDLEHHQALLETNDLFIHNNLNNERLNVFKFGIGSNLFKTISINFNYLDQSNLQSIFPIFQKDQFLLDNVADIRSRGIEGKISYQKHLPNSKSLRLNLEFRRTFPKVTRIYTEQSFVPIAGFKNIGNILQTGEAPGAIYGSAWARNEEGKRLIDDHGYPIQSTNLEIIGNPNPDLRYHASLNYKFKNFSIGFLLDGQFGGQFWNGTKALLDYHGRSKHSAELRTQEIIYTGYNQNGQEILIPILAYNPLQEIEESIFQRYGYGGVAEDYIEDASYLNIAEISLSYQFKLRDENWPKFISFSVYGNNLFQFTKHPSRNPYSKFLNHPSANGLQFFNQPLQSELGLKFNLQF